MNSTCENCQKLQKGVLYTEPKYKCLHRNLEILEPETETCERFKPVYIKDKYRRIEESKFEKRKTLNEIGVKQTPPHMLEANDDLAISITANSIIDEMRSMSESEFSEACNVIMAQPTPLKEDGYNTSREYGYQYNPEAVLEQTNEPIYLLNEILANTKQILSMLQSITNTLNNLSKHENK